MLFYEYFKSWFEAYKAGTVAEVTLSKYRMTYMRLKELAPTLDLKVIGRREYQQLINDYALTHGFKGVSKDRFCKCH